MFQTLFKMKMRGQHYPDFFFKYNGKLLDLIKYEDLHIPDDQMFWLQVTDIKIGGNNKSVFVTLSDSTFFIDEVRIDEAKKLRFLTYIRQPIIYYVGTFKGFFDPPIPPYIIIFYVLKSSENCNFQTPFPPRSV